MKKFNLHLFLSVCIGGALMITINFFTNGINSVSDLTEITGRLSYYSFKKEKARRFGYNYNYYVKLENYQSLFKIKEGYISEFNRIDFETKVKSGDFVVLTIPKSQVEELNIKDEIYLTSIKVGSLTYLQAKRVIAKENSPTNLLYAVALLLLAFVVFKFRDRLISSSP